MNSPYEIDLAACRARQKRLLTVMVRQDLDLVVLTQIEHVQYLTGVRFPWTMQPAVALRSDGTCILVGPGRRPPEIKAANEFVPYDAQLHSTLRNDQRAASSAELVKFLGRYPQPNRIGVEFSTYGIHLLTGLGSEVVDIEPDMYRLRRTKHADELGRIRHAIAATGKMYERAREIVKPGINELDVFSELQAVAVKHFGEMLTGTGNDYACNAKGGPPRNNVAQAGELYILDLGPAFRGYFADNCRAIAVNGEPTKEQQTAWQHIMEVFPIIEGTVKPGVSCKAIFEKIDKLLKKAPLGEFGHHLGHGIGLFPHETPHLNPNWDDTFQEGDVFTVEPGLYAPELRAGIRLENDYLVTRTGVENLSPFSMEL